MPLLGDDLRLMSPCRGAAGALTLNAPSPIACGNCQRLCDPFDGVIAGQVSAAQRDTSGLRRAIDGNRGHSPGPGRTFDHTHGLAFENECQDFQ